ncbi:hypothetical protein ACKI1Z_26685 [Streptomyces galilaeus]|uniref:hypothetical protein n=1 Tax=Streptomyces galilaeus TaxID=33899 RepID=UPI0038F6ABBD
MITYVSMDHAPALGDVRQLGSGDAVVLAPDAVQRKDWPRYQDAIGTAVTRGAEVHQTANTPVRWVMGADQ